MTSFSCRAARNVVREGWSESKRSILYRYRRDDRDRADDLVRLDCESGCGL